MEDSEYVMTKSWFLDEIHEERERSKTTQPSRIFKVPPKLLDVGKSVFLPETFSFGPFYYEEYKMYLNFKMRHLARLFGGNLGDISDGPKTMKDEADDIEAQSCNMVRLDEVLKPMVDVMGKAQVCYDEPGRSRYSSYNFSEMLIIDACFIVESLRLHNKFMTDDEEKQLDGGSNDSPIFATRWQLPSLLRDLMKLENQIPFFVLEKLSLLLTTSGNDEPSLQSLFATFFSSMLLLNESIYVLDPSPKRNYAHPLDLSRSLFVFSIHQHFQRKTYGKINPKLMYSAQELEEAGVAFIKKENSHPLDISFDKGVLQIPPMSIDENMTVALLNFVAYEQCDLSKKPYFTNYLLFLDSLINTTKDLEILRKNRIIRYPLGTEKEVVDLFNNFCKEMLYSFDQTYLLVDMNAVNSYCEAFYNSKWRFWWSNLKKERFSSPWTFLSLVAAIVLLILTMLQTFFTIFPYYHPN